jgi:hypothetical protein
MFSFFKKILSCFFIEKKKKYYKSSFTSKYGAEGNRFISNNQL